MTEQPATGWKGKASEGAKSAGRTTAKYAFKVSDKIGPYANKLAHKTASESFWPVANDTPQELEKAARILTTFTIKGVEETLQKDAVDPKTGKKVKKQQKVLKKIPPAAIRQAKGLAIYTAFRTGIMPLAGAGGSGILIARLPDGSWSAPASFMPQNLSAGFMFGLDIYDVVLIIRTEKALQSFYGNKFSLGAEVGVTAGPVGAGAMLETGRELSPVWSYVKAKGFYAGVEVNGTVIFSRTDEMARFYQWPGITAEEILTGKVRIPHESKVLHQAISAAEGLSDDYALQADEVEGIPIPDELDLDENETLHLPPPPSQLAAFETMTFRESWEAQEKQAYDSEDEAIYKRSGPIIRPPPTRLDRQPISRGPSRANESVDAESILSEANSSAYSIDSAAPQIPPVRDSPSPDRPEELSSESSAPRIPPVREPPSPDGPEELFSEPPERPEPSTAETKPALPPRRRPVPAVPSATASPAPDSEKQELL